MIVLPPSPTSTVPVRVKVAELPTFNVPMVKIPLPELYDPVVTELETKVMPAGNVSVSETPVA